MNTWILTIKYMVDAVTASLFISIIRCGKRVHKILLSLKMILNWHISGDYKEGYYIGVEVAEDDPDAHKPFFAPNLWPSVGNS